MKFDLVFRKLETIILVQAIREPHHADHVIGHLERVQYKGLQLPVAKRAR